MENEKHGGNVMEKLTEKSKNPHGTSLVKLKLLLTIVNREKAEFYVDLLQSFDVTMQTALLGHGTATTETLQLLGLSETDKAVIFSVIREDRAAEALAALKRRFDTIKNGKGIACTIPLTGTIGVAVYRFLSNSREGGQTKWNTPTK